MIKLKHFSVLLLTSCLLTKTAIAQGIGGAVLPANPDRFRTEFDAGFIYPQFSQFKFADVRNVFPVSGGEVIKQVFNERGYAASYYFGLREAIRLKGPVELNARFGIYNTSRHSSFSENEETPEVYVPYIDGIIRPHLTGGAVVGLFADSDLKLERKLFSYEIETDLRLSYSYRNWSLIPAIYFTYQRIQQKDNLKTTNSYDPTQMTLLAHVNSNHYNVGVNFRFTSPLNVVACWIGSIAVGAEYVKAHYIGKQTFTGRVFIEPDEQLAKRNNYQNKWGVSVGGETGVCFFCNHRVSFSILGNFRYMNILPYVKYPVPIINTQEVTGPANIMFQPQCTFGGEGNLTIVF